MDFDAFKIYIYIYIKVYHCDKIKIKSTMLRNIFWQSFRWYKTNDVELTITSE